MSTLAAFSCSGSKSSSPQNDAGPSGTPAAQACDRFFDTTFGKIGNVLVASSELSSFPYPGTPVTPVDFEIDTQCDVEIPDDLRAILRSRFEAHCVELLAVPGASVTPAWLDGCGAVLSSRPCNGFKAMPDACVAPPPAKTRTTGSQCSSDPLGVQCVAGDYCNRANNGDCGTCAVAIPNGGSCTITAGTSSPGPVVPCDVGLACAPSGGSNPFTGVCVPAPVTTPAGAIDGYGCDDSVGPHCTPGSICVAGQCQGNAAVSGACASTYDCASGLVCEPTTAGAPATVCADGAVGDLCSSGIGAACAPGLACPDSKCATAVADGSACQVTIDCNDGSFCNKVCEPWLANGSPCPDGLDGFGCASNACAGGSCIDNQPNKLVAPGASCQSSTQSNGCAVGYCGASAGDFPANCPAIADDGAPCGIGTTCLPYSQCTNGVCAHGPSTTCP